MFRRALSAAILGPSLVLASLAWSGFLALRTVFEPDRSREIAEELFDNDAVRDQLADNLANAIGAAIPAGGPAISDEVGVAARSVLDDPNFQRLVIAAFSDTHRAFLGEGDAPQSLDLGLIATSLREALVDVAPGLDSRLPAAPDLMVELPTENIPDASPARSFLQWAVPILAALAGIGALLALFVANKRDRVLRKAGIWALSTTAIFLFIGLAVPWLLRRLLPDQSEILAAFIAAILRSTLRPSIVLAICGVALIVASIVWKKFDQSRRDRARDERRREKAEDREEAAYEHERHAPQPAAYAAPPPAPAPAPPAWAPPPRPVAPAPAPPPPVAPPVAPPAPVAPVAPPAAPHMPAPAPAAAEPERWLPPRWDPEHGWVLNPNDPKPPPPSARWVDGVGYVVPGLPPRDP